LKRKIKNSRLKGTLPFVIFKWVFSSHLLPSTSLREHCTIYGVRLKKHPDFNWLGWGACYLNKKNGSLVFSSATKVAVPLACGIACFSDVWLRRSRGQTRFIYYNSLSSLKMNQKKTVNQKGHYPLLSLNGIFLPTFSLRLRSGNIGVVPKIKRREIKAAASLI